jgi:hypothetical protein
VNETYKKPATDTMESCIEPYSQASVPKCFLLLFGQNSIVPMLDLEVYNVVYLEQLLRGRGTGLFLVWGEEANVLLTGRYGPIIVM